MENKNSEVEEVMPGVSNEQIAALKKEHGEIHLIESDCDGRTVKGIFRKPDIKVLSIVAKKAQDDPIGASLAMYTNCKLIVEPEMDSSDELKMAAAKKVSELFRKFESTAKKL